MTCARCDILQKRVEELEFALGCINAPTLDTDKLRAAWGLTFSQAVVVMALWRARGKPVAHWALQMAVSDEAAETSTIKVHVYQVRRKIPHSVIETVWGRGYRLSDAGMAAVSEIIGPLTPVQPCAPIFDQPCTPSVAA